VDIGPLLAARNLGFHGLFSVGDGDPAEVLHFLAGHAATHAVLFAPGAGARPEVVRALGNKPLAVLGGEPLLRAATRRAGGMVTNDLEAWLAFGELAEAVVGKPRAPLAMVAGGGAALIARLAQTAGLELRIITLTTMKTRSLSRRLPRRPLTPTCCFNGHFPSASLHCAFSRT